MICVQDAEKIILETIPDFPDISLPLAEAYEHVLRENIISERDSPPFNRVAMDGISISYSAWKNGRREFIIQDIQKAGEAVKKLQSDEYCLEVMTGAVLPENSNCVIRVEDLIISDGIASLNDGLELEVMQNVHQKGSDHFQGSLLIHAGQKLNYPRTGVAASEGKSFVRVARMPSVAIISTGDELVDLDQDLKDYQIRMSNSYALQAALSRASVKNSKIFHLQDDLASLSEKISLILQEFDLLILSGGVSMGKFDYIPDVLKSLGVEKKFHKISQKPGKPLWYGISTSNKAVFALPGNPVSSLICFRRYILPAINKASGLSEVSREYALLSERVIFKKDLSFFMPVKLINDNAGLIACPLKMNGSGDYASLISSDAFVELDKNNDIFEAGQPVPLFRWI